MGGSEPEPSASRTVFDGKLIRVAVETWPAGEREVVHHPGAAVVVAVTADDRVVLVRQFREAVRATLLELPAGVFDVDGEDGSMTALRELGEEAGYRASEAELLGEILTSPGFADERIRVYLARGAEPTGDPPEDGIDLVLMPRAEAMAAIARAEIQDAKTIAALHLAARALDPDK